MDLSSVHMIRNQNCLYIDKLEELILNLQASGIMRFWFDSTYRYMIEAKRINFYSFVEKFRFRAAVWKNFLLIWILYLIGRTIS